MTQKRQAVQAETLQEMSFRMMRGQELFESLSDDEIRAIVQRDRVLNFHAGEFVVRKGEVGGSMFVIMEGECAVWISDSSAPERMIEVTRLCKGKILAKLQR